MKLVLLGTTGYHPSDSRQTACMMLPECGVVLDAGTGMFRVRDHLERDTLDIFLTHAHLDHVIGLTFLFDVLHQREMRHVRVHGASEKLTAIQQHLFSAHLFPAQPPIQWSPLTNPVSLPCEVSASYFPLRHPGDSLGFRLDWPQGSLAYVTDTTARDDAEYIDHIRGVDVLLHECNFPDGWEDRAELTGHSCTTPVARVARAADVGLLILVHVNPLAADDSELGVDVARTIFPNTILGTDHMVVEI